MEVDFSCVFRAEGFFRVLELLAGYILDHMLKVDDSVRYTAGYSGGKGCRITVCSALTGIRTRC